MTRSASIDAGLEGFAAELRRWGDRMNLVGSTERADIDRHFADSLAAADLLPKSVGVVDLGSGAGFPGVPIAIARPDLRVTLVEIREKRVSFLRHVARELSLRVEILQVSIEERAPCEFDFALLRAVANPKRSIELGMPWLGAAGEVWVWAGADVEIPNARATPLASGGNILRARRAEFSRGTD